MAPLGLNTPEGRALLGSAGNPNNYAPGPPPPGYKWQFVTNNGIRVVNNGVPVVELVAV